MKVQRKETTSREKQTVMFKKFDSRQREIGVIISTWETEFVALPETAVSWWNGEPGHYFAANIHVCRNGQRYGASQPDKFFDTAEQRDAHITSWIAAAKTRC